eukprot:GHVT01078776.1.p1 GENE.GHVT01078776.1~~GHVT01078776.1.p1  ORF type:complete len:249 (-),score=30.18 GHVT01078776.1:746-1492(-)
MAEGEQSGALPSGSGEGETAIAPLPAPGPHATADSPVHGTGPLPAIKVTLTPALFAEDGYILQPYHSIAERARKSHAKHIWWPDDKRAPLVAAYTPRATSSTRIPVARINEHTTQILPPNNYTVLITSNDPTWDQWAVGRRVVVASPNYIGGTQYVAACLYALLGAVFIVAALLLNERSATKQHLVTDFEAALRRSETIFPLRQGHTTDFRFVTLRRRTICVQSTSDVAIRPCSSGSLYASSKPEELL